MEQVALVQPSVSALFCIALQRSGSVDADALDRAERAASATGERIDSALIKLGLASEEATVQAWHEATGLPIADRTMVPMSPVVGVELPVTFLKAQRVLPLARDQDQIIIGMVDPLDVFVPAAIAAKTGVKVAVRIMAPSLFEASFVRLHPDPDAQPGDLSGNFDDGIGQVDVTRLKDLASDAPVIRIVNALLDRAVEQNASDIHIGMTGSGSITRFRIDGILFDGERIPQGLYAAVMSRLKIMAGLDIAERRLPQDGRIRTTWRGRPIDLRVATSPNIAGEGMVLRILDRSSVPIKLDALGFSSAQLNGLRRALGLREGLVLVTGPTGSGKSTTLYACVAELRSPDRNIVTVEDPVELRIDGINQIPVSPLIGFDFARALRSVLRQDPDVIMVGEIRDRETAQVAVQAALTGHLVLATLHTNDAIGAIPRLVDMGIEPFLLASTLKCLVAQRLARRLCDRCAGPVAEQGEQRSAYQTKGCAHCRQTGYQGRVAVAEIVAIDETLQRLISRGHDESAIAEALKVAGWSGMQADGEDKIDAGLIDRSELSRVLGGSA
jgi:general secretion pathway protein E